MATTYSKNREIFGINVNVDKYK